MNGNEAPERSSQGRMEGGAGRQSKLVVGHGNVGPAEGMILQSRGQIMQGQTLLLMARASV